MREPISKTLQLAVWYKDGWHCKYCGEAIFFSPTLKLLDLMSPGHGYYDRHGKRGSMVSLLENLCACCDHMMPVAAGGGSSVENLVAACFSCNRKKSAGEMDLFVNAHLAHKSRPKSWDGFASIYPLLPGADPKWSRLIEVEQSRHNI